MKYLSKKTIIEDMNNNIIFPKEFLYADFEHKKELDSIINSFDDEKNKLTLFEIIGDDDFSKSQFINELKKRIDIKKNYLFLTSGNIYLKQFSWQPFQELLYNFFKLRKDQNLREKLLKFTRNFQEDIAMQSIYLSELFSKKEDERKIALNKQTIFEAFRLFFLYASKVRKSFIILENIDNFDELSLELVDYLARTLKNNDFHFVITRKSRFQINIKNIDSVQIELANLSLQNASTIMKKIINGEPSEESLKFIYDNSKGSYFHFLLLVNFLKEKSYFSYHNGFVNIKDEYKNGYKEISSMANLIFLKASDLKIEEKELLSVASIFGNKIGYTILKKVIEKDSFDKNLNTLVELGFLNIDSGGDDKIVRFSTYEVMDFFYQNISANNKKEIHQKIGDVLHNFYKTNLSSVFEIIAYHYENSGDFKEAVYFYFMAGIKYRNLSDYHNGYKYLSRSQFLAKRILKIDENTININQNEIQCLNFQVEDRFFSFMIKFKLNIAAIYYFIAQTISKNNPKSEECYLKSLSFARKYDDAQFILLNKIELFHKKMYISDSFLKSYLLDIHRLAKTYGKQFYTILSLIENIFVILSNEKFENDKDILNNFFLAKRILDNPHIDIDKEEKRILLIRWHYFYSLYKRKIFDMNGEECKDIEDIYKIVLEGERYLIYENEKMSYYLKIAHRSLDKTIYRIIYLKKAMELSLKINDTLHTIYSYSGLGYHYIMEKDYDKAEDYFNKARDLCLDTDNRYELGMVYKNLGEIYISKKGYVKALEYLDNSVSYKKEFKSCEVIDNFANIIVPYTYIVFCLAMLNKYEEAKGYFTEIDRILPNIIGYTSEIPIFIQFLKVFINNRGSEETIYQEELKTLYDKLSNLQYKPIFLSWIEDIIQKIHCKEH